METKIETKNKSPLIEDLHEKIDFENKLEKLKDLNGKEKRTLIMGIINEYNKLYISSRKDHEHNPYTTSSKDQEDIYIKNSLKFAYLLVDELTQSSSNIEESKDIINKLFSLNMGVYAAPIYKLIEKLGFPKDYCEKFVNVFYNHQIDINQLAQITKKGNLGQESSYLVIDAIINNIKFFKSNKSFNNFEKLIIFIKNSNVDKSIYTKVISELGKFGVKDLVEGAKEVGYELTKEDYQKLFREYINIENYKNQNEFDEEYANVLKANGQVQGDFSKEYKSIKNDKTIRLFKQIDTNFMNILINKKNKFETENKESNPNIVNVFGIEFDVVNPDKNKFNSIVLQIANSSKDKFSFGNKTKAQIYNILNIIEINKYPNEFFKACIHNFSKLDLQFLLNHAEKNNYKFTKEELQSMIDNYASSQGYRIRGELFDMKSVQEILDKLGSKETAAQLHQKLEKNKLKNFIN